MKALFVLLVYSCILVISCTTPVSDAPAEIQGSKEATVDPDASPATKALMANLLMYQDSALMFGHQDDLAYGVGWTAEEFSSDVEKVCGKFPAVFGWDAGEIGQERNIDGVLFTNMQNWMIEVYKRGGVNTLSWHLDNPVTSDNAWDTAPAVHAIIPGGELHDEFKKTMDDLADFLAGLKTEDGEYVPVIFRPWHELNGSWFWWGKGNCSVEDFKALFKFTVEYLRDVKGLHHLLYSYSTDKFNTYEEYMERWPGDAYVDLIGYDDYHNFYSLETVPRGISSLRILAALGDSLNKPFALTETGLESIPDPLWFTEHVLEPIKGDDLARKASYMLVWRNFDTKHHYAPYPGHGSVDEFKKFEADEFTWFLDELPDMYH